MHIVIRNLSLIVAVIPCIAGLVRFNRIGKTYQPLFLMCLAGLVSDGLSRYIIYRWRMTNAGISDTYALLEWILIFWQFRVWGFFRTRKDLAYLILAIPCAVWIAENFIFGRIINFCPYFRIVYGALVVLFSVNKINFMITHDNRKLLGHPEFLICIAFIIYFVYDIVYEWAYQSSSTGETYITTRIISFFGYINALTNITFAIAFLRIPSPKKFTLW